MTRDIGERDGAINPQEDQKRKAKKQNARRMAGAW
jgi:hypothetical protein